MSKFHLSTLLVASLTGFASLIALPVNAGVTAEEAQKLKTTLTPLGAERAGNAAGTIPEWKGCPNLNAPLDKLKAGDRRWIPFADEKPLYVVTADNMAQYADKLSDGMKAVLQKYPKTLYLPVYPTHRTHCAPEWVYEATFQNATRARLVGDAAYSGVNGAINGIPFPIPKNGLEARWNHNLRWRGTSYENKNRAIAGTLNGGIVLGTYMLAYDQFEFYRQNVDIHKYEADGSAEWRYYQLALGPTYRAGEALVSRGSADYSGGKDRSTWQYLVGQRRVRRAPSVGWDTPNFVNSGADFFDEAFASPLSGNERYNYKLVGKKEMIIPYNNNKIFALKEDGIFGPKHHVPDAIRWELHRVWVIEATLAPGKRHAVPKRIFYVDEDTWSGALFDGYDATGKIWRAGLVPAYYFPDMPGVMSGYSSMQYIMDGAWASENMSFPDVGWQLKPVPMKPDSFFTPEALAGSAIR